LAKITLQERVQVLKAKATSSPYSSEQMGAIDALAKYGEEAIPAIREIVDVSKFGEVRLHGLAVIRRVQSAPDLPDGRA
jgi:hypothetical protein